MYQKRILPTALLAVLLAAGCGTDPEVAKREFMRSGDAYLADDKLSEAAIQYRSAVQRDPRFGEARKKLAVVYLQLGDVVGAYREAVRAADLLPNDVEAQVNAGQALLLAREFDEARIRAEKALAIDPRNVSAQVLRANAYAGLNRLDDAVTEIEEAIRTDPERLTSYSTLGSMQMLRGNRSEAEAAFRRAVTLAPDSVEARLGLVNFLWAAGRRPDAEAELLAVLERDPANALANRAMALLRSASGRIREAEPFLKAAADGPGTAGKLALADYYMAMGRPDDSRRLLETVAGGAGRDAAAAKLRLAGLSVGTGDPARAMALVDELLAADPTNVAASLVKGELLAASGRIDEALAAVQATADSNPASAQAQFLLGVIQRTRGNRDAATTAFTQALALNPRMARAEVELAKLSMAAGQIDRAERFAVSAARKVAGYADAYLLLTRIALARGDVARAEPPIRALVRAFPDAPAIQGELGQLELLKKNRPAARRAFARALAASPLQIDALAGLVTMDIQDKQVAAARARLEAATSAAGDNGAALTFIGRAYTHLGDAATAERVLRRAIEVDPNAFEAYGLLGRVYASGRRLPDAIAQYRSLVARQPRPVAAHTALGVLLQSQGELDEARDHYERALSIDPRAAVAANNLAWIHLETDGNLDVALELAQRAKAAQPNQPAFNHTLGWIYVKKDLGSLGVPPLLEAVERAPENATYHHHLGLAYASAGNATRARAALQRAIALDGDSPQTADVRRALDGLR